jgi:hypothetical protein
MRTLRRSISLLALMTLSVVAMPAIAADEPAGGRVATVTRLVKLFLDREERRRHGFARTYARRRLRVARRREGGQSDSPRRFPQGRCA